LADDALKKNRAFFETHYKGFDGFKAYLKDESASNDLFLRTALDIYKNNVLESLEAGETDKTEYKNELFYTGIIAPDKTGDAGYFIHAKTVLPNKKIFVTGSYVNKQAELIAFAALPDDNAAKKSPSYYLIISADNKIYYRY
jgi:hypothetical protein